MSRLIERVTVLQIALQIVISSLSAQKLWNIAFLANSSVVDGVNDKSEAWYIKVYRRGEVKERKQYPAASRTFDRASFRLSG